MITYSAICFVGTKNIALYIFDASSEASFSMQGVGNVRPGML